MPEYIERKRAIVEACNSLGLYQSEELCPSEYAKLEDALNSIPVSDVAPVRHGRWEPVGIDSVGRVCRWRCTACKMTSLVDSNYCPKCGATMDLK